MRMSVNMDIGWTGDYQREQYEVEVSNGADTVQVQFTYRGVTTSPYGGRFSLPSAVADRLGDALKLAAKGPLKNSVSFEVDQTKLA